MTAIDEAKAMRTKVDVGMMIDIFGPLLGRLQAQLRREILSSTNELRRDLNMPPLLPRVRVPALSAEMSNEEYRRAITERPRVRVPAGSAPWP